MTEPTADAEFRIRPMSTGPNGEQLQPFPLVPPGPYVIGRSKDADWQVLDPGVSRRHAQLEMIDGEWQVSDLESRAGTFLVGHRLSSGQQLPLQPGDDLRFGAWVCLCERAVATGSFTIVGNAPDPSATVSTIARNTLGGVAQLRLDALIRASQEMTTAEDAAAVAEVLVETAATGTSCRRSVVVRPLEGDEFEVLANAAEGDPPVVSRSLVATAATGEVAELTGGQNDVGAGHSLIMLNIKTALCAPMMVSGQPEAFLYLDTRGSESKLSSDAASFILALAQLGATALERIAAAELAATREQLERDLDAARRAQELLMPKKMGVTGGVRYAFVAEAGRLVAGDLFDIVPIDERRTAFFLGDVSGKGVGAALLMAAAQAKLRALFFHLPDIGSCLNELNRYLAQRTEASKFITMIAGMIDLEHGVAEIADAGHGLLCRCTPGVAPEALEIPGGMPIGIVESETYQSHRVELAPGARIVVFSDGVIEQHDPAGTLFGMDRTLGVLAEADSAEKDVQLLAESVRAYAEGPLADDLTIVSLAAE